MKYLKQRTPLGFLQNDGNTVTINREFGDDIESLVTQTITNTLTVTPADLTGLQAAVAALQTSYASLLLDLTAAHAEIAKLKGGYQS